MLRFKYLCLVMALLVSCVTANAQKKKKSVNKPQPVKTEPSVADVLYNELLASTAKVMFIDSVVVDKDKFLSAVTPSRESGSLNTYDAFWGTTGHKSAYTYVNEFGNKVLFSRLGTDGHFRLYTADKLNGRWEEPKEINDFGPEYEDVNCPYMMSDGVTLYFAAKGKNSVGGYDIFVTMYDSDSLRFYKPENVGLPYNSKADDYYYAVDEFNSIGWLVTNRNQPADKVCVYTFVPSKMRETYSDDGMTDEKLAGLAAVSSIKDTWTDKNKLQDARNRLAQIRNGSTAGAKNTMSFYVNDKLVYSSLTDFQVESNRQRYSKLLSMKSENARINASLDGMRRQYSEASKTERQKMAATILKLEQLSENTDSDITALEKLIRNTENNAYNQ